MEQHAAALSAKGRADEIGRYSTSMALDGYRPINYDVLSIPKNGARGQTIRVKYGGVE